MLWNNLTLSKTEDGVTLVRWLWEQCKPELEKLSQVDCNIICEIIWQTSSQKKRFARSQKIDGTIIENVSERVLEQAKKLKEEEKAIGEIITKDGLIEDIEEFEKEIKKSKPKEKEQGKTQ